MPSLIVPRFFKLEDDDAPIPCQVAVYLSHEVSAIPRLWLYRGAGG
jgi:hypothetical protein